MTAVNRTTIEIWKPIPDHYPYEASNLGNIRNGKTEKTIKPVLTGCKRKQYLAVYAGGGRKSTKKKVHILVLKAFMGHSADGYCALHRNDDQFDNRIENLYWGTPKDNAQDQIRLGNFFYSRGAKNGMTKLSTEDVGNILSEYTGKRGEQNHLARKYNMSIAQIHLIVHRKSRVVS